MQSIFAIKECPQCESHFQTICFPCTRDFGNRKSPEQMSKEEQLLELQMLLGSYSEENGKHFSPEYYPIDRRTRRIRELTGEKKLRFVIDIAKKQDLLNKASKRIG
ncbi:MAG: hypothetical protein NVSMB66_7640 [Candidatus Doudnabacteria bacterium]